MGNIRYHLARGAFREISVSCRSGDGLTRHNTLSMRNAIPAPLPAFVTLVLLVISSCLQAQTPVMILGQPSVAPLSDQGIRTDINVLQTTRYTVITLSMTASKPVANLVTIASIPFHVKAGPNQRVYITTTVTHSGAITTTLPGRFVYPMSYTPYNFIAPVTSDGFLQNIENISFDLDPLLGISTAAATVTITMMIGGYANPIVGPGNGKLDFDGDGKADFSVWRATNGTWYSLRSANPGFEIFRQWGTSGDIPVPGDYDGDGKTDHAIWRPADGNWYVAPSNSSSGMYVKQWGVSQLGDVPVPGDYDGDGKTDLAVWRSANGYWYIVPSTNPGTYIMWQWGWPGDIPVPGDYDGDDKTDIAVWRPATGIWYVIHSKDPANFSAQQWGAPGDTPVAGDYDRDGRVDYAVWRPSDGNWYVIPSGSPTAPVVFQWGILGDMPVYGDFDGDTVADFAVFRPSTGNWFVVPSTNPTQPIVQYWGSPGDIPN